MFSHPYYDGGVNPRPDSSSDSHAGLTPHRAYVAGWEAAHRGDDLVVVVHAALMAWPLDDGIGALAELITCASLGFWAEGGSR